MAPKFKNTKHRCDVITEFVKACRSKDIFSRLPLSAFFSAMDIGMATLFLQSFRRRSNPWSILFGLAASNAVQFSSEERACGLATEDNENALRTHLPALSEEHGTGKTSLIELALRYKPDLIIDSERNMVEPLSREVWQAFPKAALDRLAGDQQGFLDLVQDSATAAFVWNEDRIPRHMMERSSWSRHRRIIEVGDVTKEEAFQYLKLQGINDKQAAQICELVGGRTKRVSHHAISNRIAFQSTLMR
ncbi:hypothetical protein FGG08_004743 [Glutinoglossum americanum]|uniref:Uncharacterized protein n=1 Tax=Glutinoglossum americanum TaxID=1670608 RepID=A0A9P8HVU6_9PEZI|nr:hypothetical protein FGG08_004743 [Glutinoglossum americanum]